MIFSALVAWTTWKSLPSVISGYWSIFSFFTIVLTTRPNFQQEVLPLHRILKMWQLSKERLVCFGLEQVVLLFGQLVLPDWLILNFNYEIIRKIAFVRRVAPINRNWEVPSQRSQGHQCKYVENVWNDIQDGVSTELSLKNGHSLLFSNQ